MTVAPEHTQWHTHSVGLLWTRDRPVADTFTWQHKTLTRESHPCACRDSNLQSQQASGRRPTTVDVAATVTGCLFVTYWQCRSWMCFKCFRMWFLNAVDWKGGKTWDSNGRSWPSLIHFWLYSQVGKTLKRDFPCFSWSLIRPLSRKISSFLQRLKANQKIVRVLIVGQQTRTGKSEAHSSSTGKYYTGVWRFS